MVLGIACFLLLWGGSGVVAAGFINADLRRSTVEAEIEYFDRWNEPLRWYLSDRRRDWHFALTLGLSAGPLGLLAALGTADSWEWIFGTRPSKRELIRALEGKGL